MTKIAAAADEEKEPANTSKEKLVYFEPVIDHNIPMPPQVRAKRGRTKVARVKWPFTKMAIGDSVLLPEWAEPSRATAALEKAKREQLIPATFKISIRRTDEGYRAWRVA